MTRPKQDLYAEFVKRNLAAAPPITPEQRRHLAHLLTPARARRSRKAAA